MTTIPCPVSQLEAGDEYVVGLVGGQRASRTVLGILQHTPLGGALLEVRDDAGNVFHSHMDGSVDRIDRAP